jgi:glucosyl-dolichyl phosphate glucuronosyltransferase
VLNLNNSLLSIIVPTYNEERKHDLFEFLDSAAKQTYRDIEIIVVVEKSKTFYTALTEYTKGLGVPSKVIYSEGLRGISYARNLGIENSLGKIIAITDDDAILPPDWAQILVETYDRHPEAIGVTGQALPLWINSSDSWFPESLYWMIGCTGFRGWTNERSTYVTSGVNMSFRLEAFTFAKFPTNLGAGASAEGKLGFPNEDNDYAMKITSLTNKPIIYGPNVKVYHKVYSHRVQNKYVRKYAFWQGCAEARYAESWYSKGKRGPLRTKMINDLLIDILLSLSKDRKIGLKKANALLQVIPFFSLGYVSYKVRFRLTGKK